jgi:hypothetical protein
VNRVKYRSFSGSIFIKMVYREGLIKKGVFHPTHPIRIIFSTPINGYTPTKAEYGDIGCLEESTPTSGR